VFFSEKIPHHSPIIFDVINNQDSGAPIRFFAHPDLSVDKLKTQQANLTRWAFGFADQEVLILPEWQKSQACDA